MADDENVQIDGRQISDFRVVELKKELELRGLAKSGTKKELVARLKSYLLANTEKNEDQDKEDENKSEAPSSDDEKSDGEKKSENSSNAVPTTTPKTMRPTQDPGDDTQTTTSNKIEENGEDERGRKKKSRSRSPSNSRSRSRSSSRSRSRSRSKSKRRSSSSSSSTSRSRSRSKSHSRSRSRSKSGSRSKSRSKSRSRSRSKSRSRSASKTRSKKESRSRSQSSSSESDSEDEKKPKMKGMISTAVKQLEETAPREESFFTAPEDTSKDESIIQPEEKEDVPEVQEEPMETIPEKPEENHKKEAEEAAEQEPDVKINTEQKSISESAEKPVRKRRWGSTRPKVKKNTFIISTDSLKGLIPEIKPSAITTEPILDLGNAEDKEITDEEDDFDKKDLSIQRTVIQDVAVEPAREVIAAEPTQEQPADVEMEEPEQKAQKIIRGMSRQSVTGVTADEPQAARRSPSPARNPVSCYIHVRNLTRPYTLGQLKEMLGRTGTLVEDSFWIDKIKSHCIVKYDTEEEAQESRKVLHGSRWPLSNPKILRVDFSTAEEFEFHRSGEVAPSQIKRQIQQDVKVPEADQGVREVRVKEESRDRRQQPTREWDRQKRPLSRSRSRDTGKERGERERRRSARSVERSRSRERRRQERSRERREKKEKKEEEEEPPAKLLDDLFCKTKATPCIYWLALTQEQVLHKEKEDAKMEAERERRRREREKLLEEERKKNEREREERRKQQQQQQQQQRAQGSRSREHGRGRSRSGSRSRRRR